MEGWWRSYDMTFAKRGLLALAALGLLIGTTAPGQIRHVSANGGLPLEFYDIDGLLYSGEISGDNQNCDYVHVDFGSWTNRWRVISSAYRWQKWAGAPGNPCSALDNTTLIGYGQDGSVDTTFTLSPQPPHSDGLPYWSCYVDFGWGNTYNECEEQGQE
jgi:hypothetical protein